METIKVKCDGQIIDFVIKIDEEYEEKNDLEESDIDVEEK